jgi:hypothetical protein
MHSRFLNEKSTHCKLRVRDGEDELLVQHCLTHRFRTRKLERITPKGHFNSNHTFEGESIEFPKVHGSRRHRQLNKYFLIDKSLSNRRILHIAYPYVDETCEYGRQSQYKEQGSKVTTQVRHDPLAPPDPDDCADCTYASALRRNWRPFSRCGALLGIVVTVRNLHRACERLLTK